MKEIAIYGAGGFGKEIACLLNKINEKSPVWKLIGFYDDGMEIGKTVSHYGSVLGGINELNGFSRELSVIIAIGNPIVVKKIVADIINPLINFPNIIAPNVAFADKETFFMGKGNIIQSNCIFSCDVRIGDFNVFNGSVVLGHDDYIGDFNTFMPAVRISGEVKIGNDNFFGISSIVLQRLKIGNNVRIGAGSVLMTKPKDNNLYMGNPAKKAEF